MSYFILGFFTGLSLILAIGAQNIFVIEQGLKKQFVFIVCAICALSDFLLIFLGIFILILIMPLLRTQTPRALGLKVLLTTNAQSHVHQELLSGQAMAAKTFGCCSKST